MWICGGQSDTAGHLAVWALHFSPATNSSQLSTLVCHECQHWVLHVVVMCTVQCPSSVCVFVSLLQQQLLVDITVHCLLCSRNWVFGEKPEEQSCSDTVRLGVSCWLWSYMCYWANWLGSVMLTVKLHVLLSKLAGECHADCEVTCVTEQTGWCCRPSDLCCKVCSSDLGQF